jgi:hypothetical protein
VHLFHVHAQGFGDLFGEKPLNAFHHRHDFRTSRSEEGIYKVEGAGSARFARGFPLLARLTAHTSRRARKRYLCLETPPNPPEEYHHIWFWTSMPSPPLGSSPDRWRSAGILSLDGRLRAVRSRRPSQGILGWARASHPAPRRGCTRCLSGGVGGRSFREQPFMLCREQGLYAAYARGLRYFRDR